MKHLTLTDAAFLYMETDKVPTHAATLQLFEVPPENLATYLEDFRRLMFDRRYLVPYLTHRLCFVPGNIDHPEWVDDATFDPNYHIRSVDLGGKASMRDLEEAVAKLHEERISLEHPMWRTTIITGLEDGRVAHYSAIHHSCVDGAGGQQPLHFLADLSAETTWYHPENRQPEKQPTQASLYMHALGRVTKANFEQLRGIPKSMKKAGALVSRAVSSKKSFGALAEGAPKTSFNVEIDQERALALGKWPLADFKAMAKKLDCTINDVFMAVASGALREFFLRRDELPEEPLIAGCPVSIRGDGDESLNNQLSMMMVSLETQIEDPLVRLEKIRESAEIGKEVSSDLISADSPEVHAFGLPGLFSGSIRLMERLHVADKLSAIMNITISNVPGPRAPLYINGAEMTAMYPVSLPMHGTGVNLTVISYRGTMDFTITSASLALKEPQELRDDLLTAFSDLRDQVLGTPKAKKARKNPVSKSPVSKSPVSKSPVRKKAVAGKGAVTKEAVTKEAL